MRKIKTGKLDIYQGDNLKVVRKFEEDSFSLIYIDPPYNTGKNQTIHGKSFDDNFGRDYEKYLFVRLEKFYNLLTWNGSLFVHLDPRESHYIKVLLDQLFGRDHFMNEIIWAYDYGARSKSRWSWKHDVILWYVKNKNYYTYNREMIDRIPYISKDLVGEEKVKRGKSPTDVWWQTIVPTNSKERLGYPTQKPLKLIERIVKVHSKYGDLVGDFFAGSGTFGEAAIKNYTNCILIDSNEEAIEVMRKRFRIYPNVSFR